MDQRTAWGLVTLGALLEFCACMSLSRNTVDPPVDLRIEDPGHLGQLQIRWALPASLENLTDCLVRFQLNYINTYNNQMTTVITTQISHSAQFNLGKDAKVTVRTLVSGLCVNSLSELQSPDTEAVLYAQQGGLPGSKIDGLKCIFHNWEYMDCFWKKEEQSLYSQYQLYYWHKAMVQAEECPEYLQSNTSNGRRTGCRFQRRSLAEYTEFNICVNGTSAGSSLQPAYFTLQIQDHVMPDPVKLDSLQPLHDGKLRLQWTPPAGSVPEQCLEYEVKLMPAGAGQYKRNITRDSYLVISRRHQRQKACVKVRCRVHSFCADRGFWSRWSDPLCFTEEPGFAHSDRSQGHDDSSNVLPSEMPRG